MHTEICGSSFWVIAGSKILTAGLNENVLRQRGVDKKFQENIIAKDNFLNLLKKKLPTDP